MPLPLLLTPFNCCAFQTLTSPTHPYSLTLPPQIAGLIIENTFLSLPAVVHDWPYLGHLSWAVHQRWNSAARIKHISRDVPICMMSGLSDTVVPPKHLKGLWEIAQGRGVEKGKGISSVYIRMVLVLWFWRNLAQNAR